MRRARVAKLAQALDGKDNPALHRQVCVLVEETRLVQENGALHAKVRGGCTLMDVGSSQGVETAVNRR